MRVYNASVLAQLNDRSAVRMRRLIWASAKNRTTGLIENVGFWGGDDDETFTINGASRLYLGAGRVIASDPIVQDIGLSIRTVSIQLSGIDEAVQQAYRGYDLWLAPVEIHEAYFDTVSHNLLAEPNRIFKGWLNEAPVATGEENGESSVEFVLASNSRALTLKLGVKKSDESLRQRYATDAFFEYADVSGAVVWAWGEELKGTGAGSAPKPKPTPGSVRK